MHCWLAKLKQWVLLRECFPLNIANIQTLEEEAAGARPGLGTIALISHASKVMLKILQASLQQYVNRELPDLTYLEARFPYHISRAMTHSPLPCTWRPDFPGATRKAP